ncbi:hypothetical protein SAY86_021291 [Trapa natans]|uniref:inositol-phosphate phosphatase n=1 Tax=Trapa natans TaxID=22666 RepID=A0AAN7M9I2_TRANT|nr:hypothetical protein SAY86_021291 [Trapa natans]
MEVSKCQSDLQELQLCLPTYVCVDGDETVPVESAKRQEVGVLGEHRGVLCDHHVFHYVILAITFEMERNLEKGVTLTSLKEEWEIINSNSDRNEIDRKPCVSNICLYDQYAAVSVRAVNLRKQSTEQQQHIARQLQEKQRLLSFIWLIMYTCVDVQKNTIDNSKCVIGRLTLGGGAQWERVLWLQIRNGIALHRPARRRQFIQAASLRRVRVWWSQIDSSTDCRIASTGHSVSRFRGGSHLEMVSRNLPLDLAQIAEGSSFPEPRCRKQLVGLIQVVEAAAKSGAQVVMDAVNKPRNISYKGITDLVTDTDKMSEESILEVVKKNFPNHLILGEEGGIIGDPSSDYLWCIDPLDGTTNFAHGYPSFAVSVGVLFQGNPAAAAVVEFVGGPMCWNTRIFSATAGGGAFCNGEKICVSKTDKVERSLLVTGFGYEHDDAWSTNIDLFKEFTDISRGVRRLGAAAVDMCHVALGIVEAYWEYRLKPWDMAAGVLILEEAGGAVTRMDGGKFCVFDRSVLVSNGILHDQVRILPFIFKSSS